MEQGQGHKLYSGDFKQCAVKPAGLVGPCSVTARLHLQKYVLYV